MPDDLDPAATLNPAMGSYKVLPTTSYKGPYGEVVSTQRPPHRQFPMQAWGLQTVRDALLSDLCVGALRENGHPTAPCARAFAGL